MRRIRENFDEERQRILDALTTHTTRAAAAKALGYSRATLYRRIAELELQEAERSLRVEALAEASATVQRLAERMIVTLATIAANEKMPASARVAAASKVIDTAYRSHELEDLEGRLAELEKELA